MKPTKESIEQAKEDVARDFSPRLADEIEKVLVEDFPEGSKRELLNPEQLVHLSRAYLNGRRQFNESTRDPHAKNVFGRISESLIARAYVYGYLLGKDRQIRIEGGNDQCQ